MMTINELKNDIDVYLSYSNLLDDTHKVIFLSESKTNINFLIDAESEKYLFRLNKESALGLRNQIRYEYDALKTLERSYVTPRTFFLDDSTTFFDYGVLIMQYIEGRTVEYRNQKDVYEAAQILGKIHSLDTEKIDVSNFITTDNIIEGSLNTSKIYLEDAFKSDKLDIDIKLKISKFLEWGEKNKDLGLYFEKDKWNTINNTEPEASNFIISAKKRKGILIDWEKPVVSDPSKDLAYFLSPITTMMDSGYMLSEDEKDNFFKTYIMYLDRRDRDIVERVEVYTPFVYLESLSRHLNELAKLKDDEMQRIERLKEIINIDFIDKITKNIF